MPMDGPDQRDSSRAFWVGLVFWMVVCLLAVAVRGVRWEEGFERAQVLLGITPYPDGHPHQIWYWNAFSVHYYLSALLLWLTDSATLLCGLRQFIANLAIHLPIYTITWILSRRVAPAHLAVVLSILGANSVFQSYMPIAPWATKATSGLIGMGWAFAVLACFSAGRWRTGGLLFGLMPIIHLGQWPILLVTTFVLGLFMGWKKEWERLRQLATWTGIGLIGCMAFALLHYGLAVPTTTEGAYYSPKDAHAIWAEYTTHEDMHRARTDWPRFGPMGNSVMALIAVLLFAWPLAWREAIATTTRWPWLILYVYAILGTVAIAFAWIVHRITGLDVPYIVVSWMPYRLIIHLSMLLICIVCAQFTLRNGRFSIAVMLALAWLAFLPLWPWLLPGTWVDRYFSAPETALFLLYGAALPVLWEHLKTTPRSRALWAGLLLAGGVGLLGYHQMAAATTFAGFALGAIDWRVALAARIPRRSGMAVATSLGVLALGHVFVNQWQHREHLPISAFEGEVAAYLARESPPEALVLTPLDEHYQMVLNRGVVATFETRQFTSYMMFLATTTEKLFADLYGVRDGHWYDWDLWQARTEEEWQALGEAYGFRYVLSKDFHPLHLPERLRGDGLVLYEIPAKP